MAIGIIAILMIMVTGVAMVYLREFKLSRLSYDEILSKNIAEWAFEYGMLKIRNHEFGFSDEIDSNKDKDIDAKNFFTLQTKRSQGMKVQYTIESNSDSTTIEIEPWKFAIIPLYMDGGQGISSDTNQKSKKPELNTSKITNVTKIKQVTPKDKDLFWAITAMDDESKMPVAITGNWNDFTQGSISLKLHKCYIKEGEDVNSKGSESLRPCSVRIENWNTIGDKEDQEFLITFKEVSVNTFLSWIDKEKQKIEWQVDVNWQPIIGGNKQYDEEVKLKNPMLMVYNSDDPNLNPNPKSIKLETEWNFSLPTYTITATAQKWDASQVFSFSENASIQSEFLKFGVFNTDETT